MAERSLVLVVWLSGLALRLALLLGWFPAMKAKSNCGKSVLWWVYGACWVIAFMYIAAKGSLSVYFPGPFMNYVEDVGFTNDDSIWAATVGMGEGMSYDACVYVTRPNILAFMGMVYCAAVGLFYRKNRNMWHRNREKSHEVAA